MKPIAITIRSVRTPTCRALALLACGLVFSGSAALSARAADLAHYRQAGIRIGYATEVPIAYTRRDGSVTGESPEVARALLGRLGIDRVSFIATEWGSLIPGVNAGRFDIAATGMYITPARCKQVLFTNPTYKIGDTFVVARGNPKGLRSYADVARQPGTKLAMVSGSVYARRVAAPGIKDAQILYTPDASAQLQAVRAGRADAAVTTQLSAKEMADKGAGLVEVVADFQDAPEHINYGALALRPADMPLARALNAQLADYLGSDAHRLAVAPLGFDATNLPDKTAAQLCGQP